MELYRELRATVDRDQQIAIFGEILEIAREEFYAIGTVPPVGDYGIVKNNLRNVPERMVETGGTYPAPGPSKPGAVLFRQLVDLAGSDQAIGQWCDGPRTSSAQSQSQSW